MKRRINLVPLSERPRTTTDLGLLGLLVAGILIVFAVGFGYYLLDNRLADKQRELADIQQQIAQTESQVAALQQYESVKAEKDQVEAVVKGIYAARTPVSDILNDISLVIPDTIWFQSLTLTAADPAPTSPDADSSRTQISFEATTYTFEDVAQLLNRLKLVPSLKNVQLVSATGENNTGGGPQTKTFSMQGSVVDTSPDDELPITDIQVNGAGDEAPAETPVQAQSPASDAPLQAQGEQQDRP